MAVTPERTEVVRLRLICLTSPRQLEDETTEFGLQDKQRVVHAGRRQADGSIHYALDVRVTSRRGTDAPRFSGPLVHGAAAAPFLYLGWRRKEPADSPWLRRLKIPLAAITGEQIAAVARAGGGVLEARVSGAGSGTIPLLGEGWTPAVAGGA